MYNVDFKAIEQDISVHHFDLTETSFDHIYLVDDSTIDNYVHLRMLKHAAFTKKATVITQAQLAFDKLLQMVDPTFTDSLPNVIFLDLNMPGLKGEEFIENFESLPRHIRQKTQIVILSNYLRPGQTELFNNKYKSIKTCINKPLIKQNLVQIAHLIKTK